MIILSFLNKGIDVNGRDKQGFTALHVAIKARKPTLVDILFDHNTDINVRDMQGTQISSRRIN